MSKKVMSIGMSIFFISSVIIYLYTINDERRLGRLGYSNEEITQIMEFGDDQLVRELAMRDQKSNYIQDFLNVKLFSPSLYDDYVQFSNEHPHLNPEQVVSTVSFLNHVFLPTLLQSGYDQETIATWNQFEPFNQHLTEGDLISLNQLLLFAKQTGSELEWLYKYKDYEQRSLQLAREEIIDYVDFYKSIVVPTLQARGYSDQQIEAIYQELLISDLEYLLETTLGPNEVLELMTASGFDPQYFMTYEKILNQTPNRSATYVVQQALHPNVKGNFYRDIVLTPNEGSLLALVNRNYRLNQGYIPSDFLVVNVPVSQYSKTNTNFLSSEAATATELLFAGAEAAGHQLILERGFVSYETQQQLYNQEAYETLEETSVFQTPRPGHCEHQTGLAIALSTPELEGILSPDFAQTAVGQWVQSHAHRFGFIIRYPEGREAETGMAYKPYHLRYVGVDAATEIFENDWILEDYILTHAILDQNEIVETQVSNQDSHLEAHPELNSEEEDEISDVVSEEPDQQEELSDDSKEEESLLEPLESDEDLRETPPHDSIEQDQL